MADVTLITKQGKLEMLWTPRWQEQKCESKKVRMCNKYGKSDLPKPLNPILYSCQNDRDFSF